MAARVLRRDEMIAAARRAMRGAMPRRCRVPFPIYAFQRSFFLVQILSFDLRGKMRDAKYH